MELRRLARGRLADGMVIGARVRARLLGMQVLDLDADVTVSPSTDPGRPVARVVDTPGQAGIAARASTNGTVGASLDAVARSLEASEQRLEESRRRMP